MALRVVALAARDGMALTVTDIFRHQTHRRTGPAPREAAVGAPESRPFDGLSEVDRGRLPAGLADAYPVAALQAGMLYHQETGGDFPPYHNVSAIKVSGQMPPRPAATGL